MHLLWEMLFFCLVCHQTALKIRLLFLTTTNPSLTVKSSLFLPVPRRMATSLIRATFTVKPLKTMLLGMWCASMAAPWHSHLETGTLTDPLKHGWGIVWTFPATPPAPSTVPWKVLPVITCLPYLCACWQPLPGSCTELHELKYIQQCSYNYLWCTITL